MTGKGWEPRAHLSVNAEVRKVGRDAGQVRRALILVETDSLIH